MWIILRIAYNVCPNRMAILKEVSKVFWPFFTPRIFCVLIAAKVQDSLSSEFQVSCNVLLITMETIFHSTVACYYIFCYAYRLARERLSLYPFSSKFHLFSSKDCFNVCLFIFCLKTK